MDSLSAGLNKRVEETKLVQVESEFNMDAFTAGINKRVEET